MPACFSQTCSQYHGVCSGATECSAIETGSNNVSYAASDVLISSGTAVVRAPGPLKSSESGNLPCLAESLPCSSHGRKTSCSLDYSRDRCTLIRSPVLFPTTRHASLPKIPSYSILRPGRALVDRLRGPPLAGLG
jgi:hypothetical protein